METGLNGLSGLHVTNHVIMVESRDGDTAQTLCHFMEGEHVVANQWKKINAIHKHVQVE